jgi:D-hexose-6-phosphate mutarotase
MPIDKSALDGGTGKVVLTTANGAVCEVYTFGATVTKFMTADKTDLIWLSGTAKLDGTKAIRGGIPLVFPQFGAPIKEMAQHGFARNNHWTIIKEADGSDAVSISFALDNTKATHEAWPSPYQLIFEVSVQDSKLTTSLTVINPGDAFKFQTLQHTYLNVGDISKTVVKGLQNQRFYDKASADPGVLKFHASGEATISEFTDRVFVNVNGLGDKAIEVTCPNGTIVVKGFATFGDGSSGNLPSDTVVWNPWAEKAKGMGDFDDDGYNSMLCIEPGLVADFHELPKGQITLTQELSKI